MLNIVGLTPVEVNLFNRDGFIGPLPAFSSEEEIDQIARELNGVVHSPQAHPLYGRFSVRDWHLQSPRLLQLFTHPTLVSQLQSLAGEDLTLWRSKIFHKRPKDSATGWHQEWGAFNGEEIGNDRPSLVPATDPEHWWNLTVWFALTDVGPNNSPMQFVRGSHLTRYPIDMVPMPESEFWHDPFIGVTTVEDLVSRSKDYSLVLDIDTTKLFDGADTSKMSLEDAKAYVVEHLSKYPAARTLPFDDKKPDIIEVPMRKGEYVIFTERCMHGAPINHSDVERLAVNARITTTDTLIYPFRLQGEFIDGSNLDIRHHECVLLSGIDKTGGKNIYRTISTTP